MGCSPEDLPEAMNDREKWRRGSGISVLAARHDDDDDDIKLNTINYHGIHTYRIQHLDWLYVCQF